MYVTHLEHKGRRKVYEILSIRFFLSLDSVENNNEAEQGSAPLHDIQVSYEKDGQVYAQHNHLK